MAMVFTYAETGPINEIIGTWTSDGSGDASAATKKISGWLIAGETDPDGSSAPTDDYDITIKNAVALDMLAQSHDDLTDRDTANNEKVYFNLKSYDGTPVTIASYPIVNDILTIAVANAGSTKKGVVRIFWSDKSL